MTYQEGGVARSVGQGEGRRAVSGGRWGRGEVGGRYREVVEAGGGRWAVSRGH